MNTHTYNRTQQEIQHMADPIFAIGRAFSVRLFTNPFIPTLFLKQFILRVATKETAICEFSGRTNDPDRLYKFTEEMPQ